jgi:hypothetical protein
VSIRPLLRRHDSSELDSVIASFEKLSYQAAALSNPT